jgi:hypothetical protein
MLARLPAALNSSPKPVPPPALPEGRVRAMLIAVGALIAVAMFLWERRRIG